MVGPEKRGRSFTEATAAGMSALCARRGDRPEHTLPANGLHGRPCRGSDAAGPAGLRLRAALDAAVDAPISADGAQDAAAIIAEILRK